MDLYNYKFQTPTKPSKTDSKNTQTKNKTEKLNLSTSQAIEQLKCNTEKKSVNNSRNFFKATAKIEHLRGRKILTKTSYQHSSFCETDRNNSQQKMYTIELDNNMWRKLINKTDANTILNSSLRIVKTDCSVDNVKNIIEGKTSETSVIENRKSSHPNFKNYNYKNGKGNNSSITNLMRQPKIEIKYNKHSGKITEGSKFFYEKWNKECENKKGIKVYENKKFNGYNGNECSGNNNNYTKSAGLPCKEKNKSILT